MDAATPLTLPTRRDIMAAFGIVAVLSLAIATLFGGVLLRASVHCYNMLAGGPEAPAAVPEIRLGTAMGVTVVAILVYLALNVVMGDWYFGGHARRPRNHLQVVADVVPPLVIIGLVTGRMLSAVLPTTFLRGCLVALCQMLMVAALWGSVYGFILVALP